MDFSRQDSILQPTANHLVKVRAPVKTSKAKLNERCRNTHFVQMYFGQTARQNGVLVLVRQEDHHLVSTAGTEKNADLMNGCVKLV